MSGVNTNCGRKVISAAENGTLVTGATIDEWRTMHENSELAATYLTSNIQPRKWRYGFAD